MEQYHIIDNWKDSGLKIGFFGIAEEDWLGLLTAANTEKVLYEDFISCSEKLCKFLKQEKGCDLVVALTHMTLPNDQLLAASVPSIDIILGGHDHMYVSEVNKETGVFIIKSGTDFEEFSDINIQFGIQNE